MKRLRFEIQIQARAATVYQAVISPEHFEEWTAVFSPTSRFKGNWEKGSKMLFLSTDENGNVSGLISRIHENIPNQFISIEHYGLIQNGTEVTEGKEVEAVKDAFENYTIRQEEDFITLQVDSDAFPDYIDFFMETWPKALAVLKNICER